VGSPTTNVARRASAKAGRGPKLDHGIGLTLASIVFMPLFAIAKKRVGAGLESSATAREGTQNLLCAYLSVAVLAGLTLNATLGWWWADPVAALVIAAVAVREGIAAWRGEECC
jgi:divalent metal cation (Fe/Co/Zn/Cd) transporter